MRRSIPPLLTLAAGGLVSATVYFTYFDPRWITFLGGILFAAVLALFSQMSRAEWRVARRVRQIARLQDKLSAEIAFRRKLERDLRNAEDRLRAAQAGAPAEPGPNPDALYVEAILEGNGWEDPKAKLEQALREDGFLLLQQRIEPLRGGEPMCEVLLRLKEEERNLLPPGGFFPVAERYQMMEALDRWVVTQLVDGWIPRRLGEPGGGAPVWCVNVSASALAGEDFPGFVRRYIEERGIDGSRLCFEIAEPEVLAHRAGCQRLITILKPAGCRFTIDAFGSLKGSFAGLRGLPVDFVKIDGVIVQNLLRNPAELARARAIVAVCRKLGVRSIAEFVEDRATREKLRGIGVDYIQGFGVARPEPLGAWRPAPALALA